MFKHFDFFQPFFGFFLGFFLVHLLTRAVTRGERAQDRVAALHGVEAAAQIFCGLAGSHHVLDRRP